MSISVLEYYPELIFETSSNQYFLYLITYCDNTGFHAISHTSEPSSADMGQYALTQTIAPNNDPIIEGLRNPVLSVIPLVDFIPLEDVTYDFDLTVLLSDGTEVDKGKVQVQHSGMVVKPFNPAFA